MSRKEILLNLFTVLKRLKKDIRQREYFRIKYQIEGLERQLDREEVLSELDSEIEEDREDRENKNKISLNGLDSNAIAKWKNDILKGSD